MHPLIIFILFFYSVMGLENPNDTLLQLRRDLFKRYDKLYAPPRKGRYLPIYIKLHILHIYKINEASGVLSVNGFLQASWTDERLSWQPKNYQNLWHLRVPQHTVWIPIINLYNDADMKNQNKNGETAAFLFDSGYISLTVPTNFQSTCEIDHKYYPFDKHTCVMEYGRWLWESDIILRIQSSEVSNEDDILDNFALENPVWKISYRADKMMTRNHNKDSNTFNIFYSVKIRIERQAQFFTYFLIVPSTLCVFITLSIFWIPIEQHGHLKIVIAGLVIFVLFTLLSFLSWKIPSGGKSTPLIVLFCENSLIMSAVSIAATIATLKISRRSHKPIPVPYIVQNATKILLANFKRHELLALDDNQFQNETSNRKNSGWMLVSMAFDRLCFLIYACVFLYLLCNSFKI